MITFRSPSMECSLPNAELNNERAVAQAMEMQRALDGTPYSYVKTSNRESITLVFSMSLEKSIEFQEFLEDSLNKRMLLIATQTEGSDGTWNGHILTNPIEFSTVGRSNNSPGGEAVSVRIDFEGVKIV